MRKIINGKKYDTETAKKIAFTCNNVPYRDFSWWEETLYKKRTGEFFLYGRGGAGSKYRYRVPSNLWDGGEKIIPLTEIEAKKWSEKRLEPYEYEEVFGEVKE